MSKQAHGGSAPRVTPIALTPAADAGRVRTGARPLLAAALALLLTVLLVLVLRASEPAAAAPVFGVVDTTDSPDIAPGDGQCAAQYQGVCTLRAAVQELEAQGGGEIVLPAGIFKLTIAGGSAVDSGSGDLEITKAIKVAGDGAGTTVIDGNNAHRVFDIHSGGALDVRNVSIRGGLGDRSDPTGHSHGGAIHNHGNLIVVEATVSDSSVTATGWGGGAITNAGNGTAALQNVTIARNLTDSSGGGIENLGFLELFNVTLTENTSSSRQGSGISSSASATAKLNQTLLAANGPGLTPGVYNCAGPITSTGYNLDSGSSCALAGAGDLSGTDPRLDVAALNDGGSVFYYPLLAGSPAIDGGNPAGCAPVDERGAARPADGNGDGTAVCDIGSYEHPAGGGGTGGGTGAAEDRPAVSTGSGNKVTRPPSKKQIADQGSAGQSGGRGSAGGGTQQATIAGLELIAPKRFAFGRLKRGRRSLLLGFESQAPGRLGLVLKRGPKTLARGGATVTKVGDFGYRLRLPGKLRPGTYRLRVSFTPNGGERSAKTFRIKFVRKRARR